MMRDDIILKLQRIIEGNDRITWDLFPEIYDGFLEADELSKAEDRMLQFVASAVLTCTNDKLISTASVDRIAEYESALGVSGSGLSLDARRQQVIDYINRSRTINESTLHALCQSLALDCTVYERTDPQALTLGVFTEEDAEDGALPGVGIVGEIRPTVPQNLALYAGVETSFDRPLVVNHAHFSALWAGLGVVEWHEPPEPPEPPVTGNAICGSMGADYSESVMGYPAERMERGGINFTGLLRENFIPESGRMERGGINFTGLLRENFISESGVVEAPVELTAYFTSQGASATSDKTMTFSTYQLYDSSGAVILSDDRHTYTFVKAYDYAGNEVAVPSAVYAPVFNNSGTLCLAMHPGSFTAYRLTYTVSNNT